MSAVNGTISTPQMRNIERLVKIAKWLADLPIDAVRAQIRSEYGASTDIEIDGFIGQAQEFIRFVSEESCQHAAGLYRAKLLTLLATIEPHLVLEDVTTTTRPGKRKSGSKAGEPDMVVGFIKVKSKRLNPQAVGVYLQALREFGYVSGARPDKGVKRKTTVNILNMPNAGTLASMGLKEMKAMIESLEAFDGTDEEGPEIVEESDAISADGSTGDESEEAGGGTEAGGDGAERRKDSGGPGGDPPD